MADEAKSNESGQSTIEESSPELTLPNNPTPTASPATATASPVSLEELLLALNSGETLSNDTLDQIIKAGEERKKKIKEQEQLQLEEKFKVQTEPYEIKIKELQLQIEEIEARGASALEDLRKKINDAKEKARETIVAYIRDSYNPFRQSLGLGPRSLRGNNRSGTRQSSGKRNSYDLEWKDGDIKITVKGLPNNETYEGIIKIEGNSIPIKAVEKVLTDAGVELRTGGNARGIINRIRKMISLESGKKPEPMK